jgi:hypothetical protein
MIFSLELNSAYTRTWVGHCLFPSVTTMEFPAAAYDPELLSLMSRAYDDACSDDAVKNSAAPPDAARTMMALRIMPLSRRRPL